MLLVFLMKSQNETTEALVQQVRSHLFDWWSQILVVSEEQN